MMIFSEIVYDTAPGVTSVILCDFLHYYFTRQAVIAKDYWLDTGKLPDQYYDTNGFRVSGYDTYGCDCFPDDLLGMVLKSVLWMNVIGALMNALISIVSRLV